MYLQFLTNHQLPGFQQFITSCVKRGGGGKNKSELEIGGSQGASQNAGGAALALSDS